MAEEPLSTHIEHYRRAKHSPTTPARAAEARRLLTKARSALAAAADALGDLAPADMAYAGLDRAEIEAAYSDLTRLHGRFGTVPSRRSRAREPSPRFVLVSALADHLLSLGQPLGGAEAGRLRDLATDMLTEAGDDDPEEGLDHTIRVILSAKKSRRTPA